MKSEKVYCITNTYPDCEGWVVTEEFDSFEISKEEFIKQVKEENDEELCLAECDKNLISDYLPSSESIIEDFEEVIYDNTGFENCLEHEKETVSKILEKALVEIKSLESMKRHCYDAVVIPKNERISELKSLKVWKYNSEKNELEIA